MANTATPEGTLCLPAGRYEFKDMGIYIGEWLNERAVGLGLITKDKCQGEYTGLWDEGSEKSGVFLWPNAPGAMYEGEWAMNRRNGYGVFTREDWIIMGKFQDDFIVCGVKCKDQSIGKFEGSFENGFPSFGVETYADGGTYSGEYKNGVRQGLGVRRSIPYGEVINFFPEEAAIAAELAKRQMNQFNSASGQMTRRGSLTSQRSGDAVDLEKAVDEEEPYGHQMKKLPKSVAGVLRLSSKYKCGFVLSSKKSDLLLKRMAKLDTKRSSRLDLFNSGYRSRARSLSNILHPSGFKESGFRRHGSSSGRSAYSSNAASNFHVTESIFQLDESAAIDPETCEVYSGQWEGDYRQGYGICNRSDGISYEGQWYKNLRHGFGQTRYRDGTVESGRYMHGKLVFLSWTKGTKPHMLLYNYHIQREVNAAVKKAQHWGDLAKNRANTAINELEQIKEITKKAQKASQLAREYSLETRELVKEMYPEFEQPGIKYLQDMVRLMRVTKHGNSAFESALQSAKDILAGIISGLYGSDKKDKNENAVPPEVGLELPPKTIITKHMKNEKTMLSRAGSYSSKRARKKAALLEEKRREQEGIAEVDENEQEEEHKIELESGGIRTESGVENIRDIIRKGIADAFMSRIMGTMGGGSTATPQKKAEFSTEAKAIEDKPNGLPHKPPAIHRTRDSISSSVDTDACSEEEFDEYGNTIKSSSSSSFVTLAKVPEIKPQSDIPKIPLAKLFTNPTLFSDHFDQYYGAVWDPVEEKRSVYKQLRHQEKQGYLLTQDGYKQHGRYIMAAATTVNPQPLHIAGVIEYSEPKMKIDTNYLKNYVTNDALSAEEATEIMNTMGSMPTGSVPPESLSPSNYAKYLSPVYNKDKEAIHFRREWQPRRRTLPTLLTQEPVENVSRTPFKENAKTPSKLQKVKSTEREEPSKSDQVFHIIENGVRKRLYTTKNLEATKYSYDNRHFDNESAEEDEKSVFDENVSPSVVIPTTTSKVQIRSNVIVDSPQDELPILFHTFSESQTELNQTFNYMTSMPDVRVCSQLPEDAGITPLELVTLNQMSRFKTAQEYERAKEGEIVISIVDLIDWIQSNSYWISVLVFNMILSYLFLDILQKPT